MQPVFFDCSLTQKALTCDACALEVVAWLQANRFGSYKQIFQNFSGILKCLLSNRKQYAFIFCTKSILHRAPYLTVQNLDVLAQHKLNLKLDVLNIAL